MRVLVIGGRNFRDRAFVYKELDLQLQESIKKQNRISLIMANNRNGPEKSSLDWAVLRGIKKVSVFNVEDVLKNTATKPDLVIAFPGGAWTATVTRYALVAGVAVLDLRGD